MTYRRALVFSAVAVVGVIAAFAVDGPTGAPANDARRAPHLAQLPKDDAPTPLPSPLPEQPVTAMNVNVLNLPLDEGGHLVICDHSAAPRKVEVTNPTARFQLVGFTSATTLPDVGVFGMSRLCQAEFEASRLCTIGEALDTVALPWLDPTPLDFAWVRDELTLGGAAGNGSPSTGRQKLSCNGWSSTTGTGLVVSIEGGVSSAPCAEAARVACCAPVQ